MFDIFLLMINGEFNYEFVLFSMVCVMFMLIFLVFVSFSIWGGLISLVCLVCNINFVKLRLMVCDFMFLFFLLLKYGNLRCCLFLFSVEM